MFLGIKAPYASVTSKRKAKLEFYNVLVMVLDNNRCLLPEECRLVINVK
jgi:hypothetical protein